MWKWHWLTLWLASSAWAATGVSPVPKFAENTGSLRISSRCLPTMPWTVAGEHGALFGRQSGKFESWQWPVKLISNFSIRAELADYPVPIDVNALAAEIEVTPAETIITYSHAAFTIRQHMFAARGFDLPPTAAVVFFEIQSARALELSFSFTPDMLPMWPAPGHGRPNGEWVKYGDSGFYVLHTDDPKFSGLVAMPRTQPGIEVPYQEHPQTYPLELKLRFDPKTDDGLLFPLITSVLQGTSGAEQVSRAVAGLPELYHKTVAYYQHFFDDKLTIETPDARLDDALRWAEVAIDQAQVMHHNEIGLVAGYYESADSARPGYAWFFGRDTLWTTYAINSYGDFALTRRALDFLFKRQRGDGKIMHEYSQSADVLDWKQTPYFYASADSTPLLVMAMWDYVKNSGDVAYLKANWSAIQKAYQFTLAHTADNGIYSNSEGTGWVESWPTGMPHQEIYLAALDQQSANAMENLALIMKDDGDASAAQSRASATAAKVESEFYNSDQRFYAFSRNPDGSLDNTATVYPAVAWWNGGFALKNPGPMLTRWASAEFSADWGTRDISNRTSFYDPISYHQGSIWPLFTGWVSLAEYRAGRSLSGYAHMMQNANLTWTQDLGSVTELLSGEFFQPLGRSSSHQLWSSAMVLSPLLRGLFGLDPNALRNTLHLSPNVPAEWDHAILHHVRVGATNFDLCFQRQGTRMHVTAKNIKGNAICLSEPRTPCRADYSKSGQFSYELPPIELSIATSLPPPGSETAQLKVLDQQRKDDSATFVLEAQGGSSYSLFLRPNRPDVSVEGGQIVGGRLQVTFPAGAGYRRQTLTFHWKKS